MLTHKNEREIVIPLIAFIEGGITLPIGRVTKDYLIAHRLCPHQCALNLFRVLGKVDALNEQMGLRLTWHDVIYMYECHSFPDSGYYLNFNLLVQKINFNMMLLFGDQFLPISCCIAKTFGVTINAVREMTFTIEDFRFDLKLIVGPNQ